MPTKKDHETLKEAILQEESRGNIVVMGIEGPQVMNLEHWITQPLEGILYDLNHDRIVILAFLGDTEPDIKWVNKFAAYKTIKYLYDENQRLKKQIKELS